MLISGVHESGKLSFLRLFWYIKELSCLPVIFACTGKLEGSVGAAIMVRDIGEKARSRVDPCQEVQRVLRVCGDPSGGRNTLLGSLRGKIHGRRGGVLVVVAFRGVVLSPCCIVTGRGDIFARQGYNETTNVLLPRSRFSAPFSDVLRRRAHTGTRRKVYNQKTRRKSGK